MMIDVTLPSDGQHSARHSHSSILMAMAHDVEFEFRVLLKQFRDLTRRGVPVVFDGTKRGMC